ncbi:MAG: ABC transporter permease [Planctomycetes bacterium]|nr:ABC transporter permease [Planctomycetota bacterium]
MYRLFLALRYLLSRPINLLGMAGITISVWALIVVVAVFTGFLDVVERHVHAANADIVVVDLPSWSDSRRLMKALRDDPQVAGTAPRLLHYGLLLRPGHRPPPAPLPGRSALHGGDQPFLFVQGIDPRAEATVTGFAAWFTDPEIPAELRANDQPLLPRGGLPTVLVSLHRMQKDGLAPGDKVVLTTARLEADTKGNRTPRKVQIELVVAGAFKTAHSGFDGNTVFVAQETLQRELFPDQPDVAQEIAVRVHDQAQLDETAARLQRIVLRTVERDFEGWGQVLTWRQKNGPFLESVQHQRALMQIVLIVIMVVAAFLMLATLSMMVNEKVADIGILCALGGTPLGVTQVFLACGLVITACGVALGTAGGIVTGVYLEEVRQCVRWLTGIDLFPIDVYNLDRVPCSIDPLWLLQVAGMAFATGLVVSSLPALRAARHDPLVSLRAG